MIRTPAPTEPTVERKVFPAWSIEIPASFDETFVSEGDDYWHAYDEHRSVSLSSVVLTEEGHPVSAARILRQLGPLDGAPVNELPPGLHGIAATSATPEPARATRVLQGLLATNGRVLVASITSDDAEWALRVWLSIRSHPAPLRPFTASVIGDVRRHRTH